MSNSFQPSGPDDRENSGNRSRDRDSLFLKALLRLPSEDKNLDVRVRNLSAGGLMAEAPVQVANGDLVEIELRNVGWIAGKVAWTAEGRFGIAFDHPIDPRAVRQPVGQNNAGIPPYLRKLNEVARRNKPRGY